MPDLIFLGEIPDAPTGLEIKFGDAFPGLPLPLRCAQGQGCPGLISRAPYGSLMLPRSAGEGSARTCLAQLEKQPQILHSASPRTLRVRGSLKRSVQDDKVRIGALYDARAISGRRRRRRIRRPARWGGCWPGADR